MLAVTVYVLYVKKTCWVGANPHLRGICYDQGSFMVYRNSYLLLVERKDERLCCKGDRGV
jgi:hypothetical protein